MTEYSLIRQRAAQGGLTWEARPAGLGKHPASLRAPAGVVGVGKGIEDERREKATMGEARKKSQVKRGDAADLRWIPIRNEVRWIALQILRDCAAESREEKRHLFKAIAAIDYDEEEKDAVDAFSEGIAAAWNAVRVNEGTTEEIDRRKEWKTLLFDQKVWKNEEEVVALSTETIKTIVDQIMGYKKLAGGGAELLVPWCDEIEQAAKAQAGDPSRTPPARFYPPDEPKDNEAVAAPPVAKTPEI